MTGNKRYTRFIDDYEDVYIETPKQTIKIGWEDNVFVDSIDGVVDLLNEQYNEIQRIYSTLDNRMEKLQEDLEKLKELDNTEDLNPRAVEDVALVLSISLNALKEFKKELIGD